jgi:hypothetical protein
VKSARPIPKIEQPETSAETEARKQRAREQQLAFQQRRKSSDVGLQASQAVVKIEKEENNTGKLYTN